MKLILKNQKEFFNFQSDSPVNIVPGTYNVSTKKFGPQEWIILLGSNTGLMKVQIENDPEIELIEN